MSLMFFLALSVYRTLSSSKVKRAFHKFFKRFFIIDFPFFRFLSSLFYKKMNEKILLSSSSPLSLYFRIFVMQFLRKRRFNNKIISLVPFARAMSLLSLDISMEMRNHFVLDKFLRVNLCFFKRK